MKGLAAAEMDDHGRYEVLHMAALPSKAVGGELERSYAEAGSSRARPHSNHCAVQPRIVPRKYPRTCDTPSSSRRVAPHMLSAPRRRVPRGPPGPWVTAFETHATIAHLSAHSSAPSIFPAADPAAHLVSLPTWQMAPLLTTSETIGRAFEVGYPKAPHSGSRGINMATGLG